MLSTNVSYFIALLFYLYKVNYSEGIVDGTDAEPEEFPFMVSLRNESDEHYCGGSLITRRHIVTAAHCLFTDRSVFGYKLVEMYDPEVIKAVVDTVTIDKYHGEVHQAKKLLPHPFYNVTNPHSIFHDIGIIELQRDILNERVVPIPLPTKPIAYDKTATVIGWGIDNRDNIHDLSKIARLLQKVDMKIMTVEDCINEYLVNITHHAYATEALFANTAFCSFHERANTCYRDSGSPLIQDGKLAGIVIFGNGCALRNPDIFTSVYHYTEYIIDCIDDRCTAVTDVRKLFERAVL